MKSKNFIAQKSRLNVVIPFSLPHPLHNFFGHLDMGVCVCSVRTYTNTLLRTRTQSEECQKNDKFVFVLNFLLLFGRVLHTQRQLSLKIGPCW